MIIGPISMLVAACSKLAEDLNDPGLERCYRRIAIAGECMNLLIAALIFCYAFANLLGSRYKYTKFGKSRRTKAFCLFLAMAVLCCCVIIRASGAVAYFVTGRQELEPTNGSWRAKVLLFVGPEWLAIAAAMLGGSLDSEWPVAPADRAVGQAAQSGQMGADGARDAHEFQSRQGGEERAEGPGMSGHSPGEDRGASGERRLGFPAERIPRTDGVATPRRRQAQAQARTEGAGAGARAGEGRDGKRSI